MNPHQCDLIITGFGPFPRVRINPSAVLAQSVARHCQAASLVLETSYAGGLPRLAHTLAALKPRAVLMLGVAARARWVRVEVFARSGASLLAADATGRTPTARSVNTGNLPMRSTASTGQALAALRQHRINARLSESAGRYLCNASYRLALEAVNRDVPVIFIHVPLLRPAAGQRPARSTPLRRPSPARLGAALSRLATGLICQSRLNRRSTLSRNGTQVPA